MKTRASLAEAMAPELKPYLSYSLGLHIALALAAWRLVSWQASGPKANIYSIDFVGGPAAVITSAGPSAPAQPSAAPAAETRPAPQTQFDEFGRRRRTFVLPRPSLLRGWQAKKEEAASSESKPAAPAAVESPAAGAGAEASADMPNFPYPWYIARVRQLLWEQWQSRMPRQPGECVVVFSLLPNGSVVDLRTESTSGDSAFDLAALGAVQDAAPYPPLPSGFPEPFLKVHVTLRSQ